MFIFTCVCGYLASEIVIIKTFWKDYIFINYLELVPRQKQYRINRLNRNIYYYAFSGFPHSLFPHSLFIDVNMTYNNEINKIKSIIIMINMEMVF